MSEILSDDLVARIKRLKGRGYRYSIVVYKCSPDNPEQVTVGRSSVQEQTGVETQRYSDTVLGAKIKAHRMLRKIRRAYANQPFEPLYLRK